MGKGPRDLVVVHGWMATGDTFSPLVAELSNIGVTDGWRVTQVDLRGAGGSDRPDSGYDHDQLVADLLSVFDAASLVAPVILAHSMGGQLALMLAAAHPDRVSGLVLIAPVPTTGLHLPDQVASAFAACANDVDAWGAVIDMSTKSLSDDARSILLASAGQVSPTCMAQTLEMWTSGQPECDVGRIVARTVIIGTDDGFLPQDLLQAEIADRVEGARLLHMEGVGHYPHLEATAELAGMLKAVVEAFD